LLDWTVSPPSRGNLTGWVLSMGELRALIAEWPMIAGMVAVFLGGILAAKTGFVKGFIQRQADAVDGLKEITKEREKEEAALAKLRSERIAEMSVQLTETKSQLAAVEDLYARASQALADAHMKEPMIMAQLKDANDRILQLQAKLNAYEKTR
jgi:Mg2+ and Co2+ transporter CorA